MVADVQEEVRSTTGTSHKFHIYHQQYGTVPPSDHQADCFSSLSAYTFPGEYLLFYVLMKHYLYQFITNKLGSESEPGRRSALVCLIDATPCRLKTLKNNTFSDPVLSLLR